MLKLTSMLQEIKLKITLDFYLGERNSAESVNTKL